MLQGASGGACATTALVNGGHLYVAHLGDCRAVLSRSGGAAAALTADHTCASEDERARVERDGGYVSRSGSGVWRVQAASPSAAQTFRLSRRAGSDRVVQPEPQRCKVPIPWDLRVFSSLGVRRDVQARQRWADQCEAPV
ncbi:hypothetical protein PR202_ga21922 [Eleusine coracana subsp. coracana]|uniref:protein-serine/threonine phosphatase n=1 Tax=Eleusine coracana subsp. coracana TaxID=191504 RepID=A0AAV5D268_ELECO|nr:hypothetical protein PR202_ga21922 [Eleusine coracana subsp. coracana]